MVVRIATLILVYILTALSSCLLWSELPLWLGHRYLWHFVGGLAVGLVASWQWVAQASFYATLRHELCHWLWAVLCFRKPNALQVGDKTGGYYSYMGKRNYMILLSPYFFPITSYALWAVSLLFHEATPLYYILMGLALGFDSISMAKDYHPRQVDWRHFTRAFSVAFALPMYVLSVELLLSLLLGRGLIAYLLGLWGQCTRLMSWF